MTLGLAEILESYRYSKNLMSSNCLNLRDPNKGHYTWFPKRRQRGGGRGHSDSAALAGLVLSSAP